MLHHIEKYCALQIIYIYIYIYGPTVSLVSMNSNLWVELKIFFLDGMEGDCLGAPYTASKDPTTENPGCLIS